MRKIDREDHKMGLKPKVICGTMGDHEFFAGFGCLGFLQAIYV